MNETIDVSTSKICVRLCSYIYCVVYCAIIYIVILDNDQLDALLLHVLIFDLFYFLLHFITLRKTASS
jgi:hypothetical protein